MPLAVVIGVPLYSNAAGVLPLVEVLHDKGLPMGTVLAFMMSVVALSLPEMILLRRVLKPKLIATYVAVVATGILRDRLPVQPHPLITAISQNRSTLMDIKILGTGCVNCKQPRDDHPRRARRTRPRPSTIEKVTDPGEIVSWGVMSHTRTRHRRRGRALRPRPPADQIRQLLAAAR